MPSFDALVRSRTGWGVLSSSGKAKMELTGDLALGTALVYSKVILATITMRSQPEGFRSMRPRSGPLVQA